MAWPKHHSTLSSNTLPILLHSIDLRRPLRSLHLALTFACALALVHHILKYSISVSMRCNKNKGHESGETKRIERSRRKKENHFQDNLARPFKRINVFFHSFFFCCFIFSSLSSSFINTFIFRGPGKWTKGDRIHSFRILYIISSTSMAFRIESHK